MTAAKHLMSSSHVSEYMRLFNEMWEEKVFWNHVAKTKTNNLYQKFEEYVVDFKKALGSPDRRLKFTDLLFRALNRSISDFTKFDPLMKKILSIISGESSGLIDLVYWISPIIGISYKSKLATAMEVMMCTLSNVSVP